MKTKLLNDDKAKTYAIIFDPGDEVIDGLTKFASEQNLDASHFTAIGAFERATLGYFDMAKKDYIKIPIEEQVEVLSLVGDVTKNGDKPKVHAHVVVGKRDGTTMGGHVLEGYVRPTLEVVIVESPRHLQRLEDPATGLALIKL